MPRLVVLLLLAALAALPFPGAAGAAGAESLRRALKTVHAPTGRPTLPVNPFVSSLEAKLGVLIPSANVAPCEALLGLLSSSANSVVLGLERSSVISVCGINSTSAVLSKFLHLFGVVVVDPVTSHPAPAPSPSIFISNPHNLTVAQAQLIAQLEDLISPFHSSSTSENSGVSIADKFACYQALESILSTPPTTLAGLEPFRIACSISELELAELLLGSLPGSFAALAPFVAGLLQQVLDLSYSDFAGLQDQAPEPPSYLLNMIAGKLQLNQPLADELQANQGRRLQAASPTSSPNMKQVFCPWDQGGGKLYSVADPNAYYTISTGNLCLQQGGPNTGRNWQEMRNTPGLPVAWSTDCVDSGSHWRLVGSTYQYKLVNRRTGQALAYGSDWRGVTTLGGMVFSFSCDGTFLTKISVSGVQDGFMRCTRDGYASGRGVSWIAETWQETFSTGCKPYYSCQKVRGDSVETSSTDYMFCTDRSCTFRNGPTAESKIVKSYKIEVVAQFRAPDVSNPPVITWRDDSLDKYVNALTGALDYGGLGIALNKVVPFGSTIASFALGQLFPQPTVQEQLKSIVAQLTTVIENMVIDHVTWDNTRTAQLNINLQWCVLSRTRPTNLRRRRENYMNGYMAAKYFAFERILDADKLAQLKTLIPTVKSIAGNFESAMRTMFPAYTDYETTGAIKVNDYNIMRAQKGFKYLTLGVAELMNVLAEGVALDAYTSPEAPGSRCTEILVQYQIKSKTAFYSAFLQKNFDLLYNRRANSVLASYSGQDYTCQVNDDPWLGKIYYFSGGGAANLFHSVATPVANAWRSELQLDLTYLSYNQRAVQTFLSTFEANSLMTCQNLRRADSVGDSYRLAFKSFPNQAFLRA